MGSVNRRSRSKTGDSGTKELRFGAIDSQIGVIAAHSGANRMLELR